MEIARELLGTIGLIIFGLVAIIQGYITLKKINKIKGSEIDENVEATVVKYNYVYRSSDIKPVFLYEVDGKKKLYEFYTFHRRKEYPIGKICILKLSKKSGMAYDKRDVMKGKIYQYFFIFIGVFCIGLIVTYYLKKL